MVFSPSTLEPDKPNKCRNNVPVKDVIMSNSSNKCEKEALNKPVSLLPCIESPLSDPNPDNMKRITTQCFRHITWDPYFKCKKNHKRTD